MHWDMSSVGIYCSWIRPNYWAVSLSQAQRNTTSSKTTRRRADTTLWDHSRYPMFWLWFLTSISAQHTRKIFKIAVPGFTKHTLYLLIRALCVYAPVFELPSCAFSYYKVVILTCTSQKWIFFVSNYEESSVIVDCHSSTLFKQQMQCPTRRY